MTEITKDQHPDLLPCPHCGGKQFRIRMEVHRHLNSSGDWYYLRCDEAGCGGSMNYPSLAGLAERWNCRATLSSRSAEAGKPVVKGLEWVPSAFDTQYGLIIRIAKTPFGPYKILKGTQGRYEVYFGNAPYSGSMDDEDQAKAWAYSDYEARVLSALEVGP